MTYAPSEDSAQPGHLPSLNRDLAVRMNNPWVLSDRLSVHQTGRMSWLIRVFAGRTGYFAGFVVLRLKCL